VTHSLKDLLLTADRIYGYSEDDKRILRNLYRNRPDFLREALESDPLVMFELSPKGLELSMSQDRKG